ncbi:MAG: NUDIX hydrolase [Candidatus Obscuribacterales bacterium]
MSSPAEMTRVGVGVLVVRSNRLLLGKRRGAHMPGLYAAPGGHLEFGESFAQCAAREVLEETGLAVDEIEFLTVGNYLFGDRHYVDVDMIARSHEGEPRVMEPDKVESWDWYGMDDLPSPLFIVTRRMIEAFSAGFSADEASVNSVLAQETD